MNCVCGEPPIACDRCVEVAGLGAGAPRLWEDPPPDALADPTAPVCRLCDGRVAVWCVACWFRRARDLNDAAYGDSQ